MSVKAQVLADSGKVAEINARVFETRGSAGDVYVVTLTIGSGGHPVMLCTCEAGRHDRRCYHVDAALIVAQRDNGREG